MPVNEPAFATGRLALLAASLLLAACAAPTYAPASRADAPAGARVREGTLAEHQLVLGRLLPLMSDLGYPVERSGQSVRLVGSCGIRLAVVTVSYIQGLVLQGTTSPCTHMTLLITEGALRGLPGDEMQALLAHELAHVHLKHTQAFQALSISPATLTGLQFNRDQESEADRFAALMLKRVGGGRACFALVELLGRINSATGSSPPETRSTHPNLVNRIREARRSCEIL
jgi:Zn-dependent protease with chaperone function